jgi:hypothetical protein
MVWYRLKGDMKKIQLAKLSRAFKLLAIAGVVFLLESALKADVVVLQSGVVITGNVLQQDSNGVFVQTEAGTFRYPPAWIKEVRREPAAVPHVSNNGQVIPDWAQIVSLLANSGFAPAIQQVPATVIGYGTFKNVPYISFRCGYGDYEINIFGDLNQPAAIQIGAMNYLHQTAVEKTNCVNFICSVLANAADRKRVRALDWNVKDLKSNGGLTFETLLPGEMGSYGGWWVLVYDTNALVGAQASDAELLAITQPRMAASATPTTPPTATATNVAPAVGAAPPVTTTTTTTYGYGTDYGWTAEELAAAHPGDSPAAPANVYPRTYTRTAGTYGSYRR